MKRAAALAVLLAAIAGAVWAHGSPGSLPSHARADLVVVDKSERLLTLYAAGVALRSYRIALGRAPTGAKQREGDNRTPEGRYLIDARNERSGFHRALRITYPSTIESSHAHDLGCSPGGDVMIHGLRHGLGWLGRAHRAMDWTRGCIAVTNEEIDEIWRVVPDGTPIEIRP